MSEEAHIASVVELLADPKFSNASYGRVAELLNTEKIQRPRVSVTLDQLLGIITADDFKVMTEGQAVSVWRLLEYGSLEVGGAFYKTLLSLLPEKTATNVMLFIAEGEEVSLSKALGMEREFDYGDVVKAKGFFEPDVIDPKTGEKQNAAFLYESSKLDQAVEAIKL